jgi:DNA-binding winged helix-turn-helix (wHTH) protein/TolB-like protein/Tfp pilus assembly protein PilF
LLPKIFHFDDFDLDTRSGELRQQGVKIRLPNQSFQILVTLLERPGELVTREELRQRLWGEETFVNFDAGVASAVKKLREALTDSADTPRFVETLPKRGFRFIAPVTASSEMACSPGAAELGGVPHAPAVTLAAVVTRRADARAATEVEDGEAPSRSRRKVVALTTAVVVALATAAAVLALDLGGWRHRVWGLFRPDEVRSIAVLPLQNLTGDPTQDALIEAVSDSLITELVRAGLIEVASRTSAAQLAKSGVAVAEVSGRLEVDAVVEGTVSRPGDDWLINLQLIHGASDRHLWAQRYERTAGEIAEFPRLAAWEILRAIPHGSQPRNGDDGAHRRPATAEAYEAYILGRHVLAQRGRNNLATAVAHFERAVASDPGYAPAYSGLSDAYRLETLWGVRGGNLEKAEAAARRALALDDALAEAHTSLGGILWRQWKWDEAERELRQALDLDPYYAEGLRVYGTFLLMLRRMEEAVTALRQARELDPLSLVNRVEYAFALTQAKRYDEALRELERARDLDPSFARIYKGIAFVHAARGEWALAAAALEDSPRHLDGPSDPWLVHYYAVGGREADALRTLGDIEAYAEQSDGWSIPLGIAHLGLGHVEQAMGLLEKGIDERRVDLNFTTLLYDLLKDQPRYEAILHDMGLSLLAGGS